MWKMWLAFGLAGAAVLITVIIGFINGIRFSVILYRAVVSFFLLSGGVFLTAVVCERFLIPYLQGKQAAQESISVPDSESMETAPLEEIDEEAKQAEFSPLTAESLNRVSPPGS